MLQYMSIYQKPYLPPAGQVSLLQSRGMKITDIAKAENALSRIGYYRLSAYWYPFRKTSIVSNEEVVEDDFKDGTTFAACLGFYVFDKQLRLLAMDALERVEIGVRTDIALLLGKHDPEAHRNPTLLHGNFAKKITAPATISQHQKWLEKHDASYSRSKEEFVRHFKKKYPHSNMPIWMAVELWDFGSLSHFFAGMSFKDQSLIAGRYGLSSGNELKSWLHCLNFVRNTCAHHGRLWNKPFVIMPKWPKPGILPNIDHIVVDNRFKTRFYAAAVILKVLLNRINPTSTWSERLCDHMSTLPDNPFLGEGNAGFPPDWRKLDLWK